jgi:[ribosomal protein S18]-alanine N-acetyltransferase
VQFTVRSFRSEDFGTLWEIDQSCFPPGISYSRHELKSFIRRPRAFALVAEHGEDQAESRVLGFLVAEASSRGIGHIITIDVLSEARRQRIGSALLSAAEGRLRSAKCTSVRLEAAADNVTAITFYKRHQYYVLGTIPRYYSNGVDALVLEKDLLSPDSNS